MACQQHTLSCRTRRRQARRRSRGAVVAQHLSQVPNCIGASYSHGTRRLRLRGGCERAPLRRAYRVGWMGVGTLIVTRRHALLFNSPTAGARPPAAATQAVITATTPTRRRDAMRSHGRVSVRVRVCLYVRELRLRTRRLHPRCCGTVSAVSPFFAPPSFGSGTQLALDDHRVSCNAAGAGPPGHCRSGDSPRDMLRLPRPSKTGNHPRVGLTACALFGGMASVASYARPAAGAQERPWPQLPNSS